VNDTGEEAGKREHGVIGLVELFVELGETFDGDLFDIVLRADGRFAVVVP